MKFNWKKIVVSGVVAGMVIVTGCAGGPEMNHGNRNGERLTNNAVTRNVDGNAGTRAVRTTRRVANDVTNNVTNPNTGRLNNRTGTNFRDGIHSRQALNDGQAIVHNNALYIDGQTTMTRGSAVTPSPAAGETVKPVKPVTPNPTAKPAVEKKNTERKLRTLPAQHRPQKLSSVTLIAKGQQLNATPREAVAPRVAKTSSVKRSAKPQRSRTERTSRMPSRISAPRTSVAARTTRIGDASDNGALVQQSIANKNANRNNGKSSLLQRITDNAAKNIGVYK